ncbi:hypothetical protein JXD20_02450 [Candidatus Peregrinibacteria bacterium]|nr:hypothetical protein [Candidatus Peregrinibacteria bacterium]
MKNKISLSILVLLVFVSVPVYADSLESVRVIKFWGATDDLVVERVTGEKLLLQHGSGCMTMSTEFPMQILWDEGEITQAKVAFNELCDVRNYGPYSSELTISKRIPSINIMTREHLAEVDWKGNRYEIDYSEGCTYLRDYVGETAYVYTPQESLEGATLYLPKARGECEITSAAFLKALESPSSVTESPIKNLGYTAENNQVFFSWDKFPEDEIWLTLIAYSKYPLNPDEYSLQQLPNLRRSRYNFMRIYQLVNNQPYYFYITASNASGELAPWQEIPITPVQTAPRFINNPDPELFEIEMTETDDSYHLVWPDKSEHSRRHLIMLYVDGVRQVLKIIPGEQNYFDVEKKPEWASSRFRFTVRTIPKVPTGQRYFDSIFWRKG